MLLLAVGCGKSSPEADLAELREQITRKLPAGWQVGTAKDAGFQALLPTKPGDLLVWKTQPVALEWRTEPVATQLTAHVYFTLALEKWIEPTDFLPLYKENEELKKQHAYHRAKMANVPRDPSGKYMPRGVADWYKQYYDNPEKMDMYVVCAGQIRHYADQARAGKLLWTMKP